MKKEFYDRISILLGDVIFKCVSEYPFSSKYEDPQELIAYAEKVKTLSIKIIDSCLYEWDLSSIIPLHCPLWNLEIMHLKFYKYLDEVFAQYKTSIHKCQKSISEERRDFIEEFLANIPEQQVIAAMPVPKPSTDCQNLQKYKEDIAVDETSTKELVINTKDSDNLI